MAKSKYENVPNKDLVSDAVERKLTVETAVIWEGDKLKSPERSALIEMLEKDDASKEKPKQEQANIYAVSENILNKPVGYSAKVDDVNITVIPHLYGEGFNSQNEKINVIKEPGFVLMNGQKTESGKFENLTDKQLYELVSAGVIKLTPEQEKAFRKQFFGITDKK